MVKNAKGEKLISFDVNAAEAGYASQEEALFWTLDEIVARTQKAMLDLGLYQVQPDPDKIDREPPKDRKRNEGDK